MYFGTGWPKCFENPSHEAIVGVEYSSSFPSLLAVITSSSVFIWSGDQHRVLLGFLVRDSLLVEQEGANKSLVWKNDASMIGVCTTGGLLHIYRLTHVGGLISENEPNIDDEHNMFSYHFLQQTQYYVPLPSKRRVTLSISSVTVIEHGGPNCMVEYQDRIISATQHGYFASMSWKGEGLKYYFFAGTSWHYSRDLDEFDSPSHQPQTLVLPSPSPSPSSSALPTSSSSNQLQAEMGTAITQLIYNKHLGLFGVVLANGNVALLSVPPKTSTKDKESPQTNTEWDPRDMFGRWLNISNASCIAFSTRHQRIAIGKSTGEVVLLPLEEHDSTFSFSDEEDEEEEQKGSHSYKDNRSLTEDGNSNKNTSEIKRKKRESVTLSLEPWEIPSTETGGVSHLEWTPDGCALAVGWQRRGLSVWSTYGCRLMCTVPQFEGSSLTSSWSSLKTSHPPHKFVEPLKSGVASLAWSPEGYHLVTAGNGAVDLVQFGFVKSCLARNTNLNSMDKVMLQGEDRLLVLSRSSGDIQDLNWNQIQIPRLYLEDNWPIKYSSMSPDGQFLAVAGSRGIATYSVATRRWNLFGDRQQEQSFGCRAMCWFRDSIIVASKEIRGKQKYQLLCFPRIHLSFNQVQHFSDLPHQARPRSVDCNGSHLVVLTDDSHLCQYSISETKKGATNLVTLTLLSHFSISHLTSHISGSLLLPQEPLSPAAPSPSPPSLLSTSPSSPALHCLLLDSFGTLSLLHVHQHQKVELAQSVEQFWFSNNIFDQTLDLGNALWAYGRKGIQVWFPFRSDGNSNGIHLGSFSLEFNLEVYPLGFSVPLGVILGLSQGVNYGPCSVFPSLELRIKPHPFLYSILLHLLDRGDENQARAIARSFSFIPYFSHSLELLLHETLEKVEVKKAETWQRLESAMQLLRRFPQFPDVVVNCARKTDSTVWRNLFRYAGDPEQLFEECLKVRRIRTAASYLRILQYLKNPVLARKCAAKLLGMALDSEDMELVQDLMRFLDPIEDSEAEGEGILGSSENGSENGVGRGREGTGSMNDDGLTEDDEEFLMVEVLLSRYARKLLSQHQLKQLLRFAGMVNRPLQPWLVRERRRACVIPNLGMGLEMVHAQFNLPFPEEFEPIQDAVNVPKSTSGTNAIILTRVQSPTLLAAFNCTEPDDSETAARQDLEYLLDEMTLAQCTEWSLMLSTVLFRSSTIVDILRCHFALWKPYSQMLQSFQSQGYQELYGNLHYRLHSLMQSPSPSPPSPSPSSSSPRARPVGNTNGTR